MLKLDAVSELDGEMRNARLPLRGEAESSRGTESAGSEAPGLRLNRPPNPMAERGRHPDRDARSPADESRDGAAGSKPDGRKGSFLQEARRRRSMPERLDRMLVVTSARGWIALLSMVATAAAVAAWSIVGEIATYVEAQGFLLNRDGEVVDATAHGRGQLTEIAIAVGDEVEKGAAIAWIENKELSARHATALALVEERTRALDALKTAIAEESGVVRANNDQRRNQIAELEATARDTLEAARSNLAHSRQLFDEKVVTSSHVRRAEREFNAARRTLLELARDRGTLEANEIAYENKNAARVRDTEAQVEAAKRGVRELGAVVAAEKVVAPVGGKVTEVKITVGAAVAPGTAVASIRSGTEELEVLLYVAPADGKQVEAGMPALVTPATVRREEFGSIKGTVRSVSPFPVSFEGMVAVLQNRNLAQTFSKKGPPYAGRIALTADPTTASGFAWTSPRGSDQRLTAGTLASIEIKTRSQPPITLAVPLLKDLLGLR